MIPLSQTHPKIGRQEKQFHVEKPQPSDVTAVAVVAVVAVHRHAVHNNHLWLRWCSSDCGSLCIRCALAHGEVITEHVKTQIHSTCTHNILPPLSLPPFVRFLHRICMYSFRSLRANIWAYIVCTFEFHDLRVRVGCSCCQNAVTDASKSSIQITFKYSLL